MADDSDDVIYVDVVARLDEASADEAEEKLRDKFKDAAKDLGTNIKDHLQSAGETIRDVFRSDTMRDLGRELGQTVAEELGTHVQDAAGGIGKYVGQSLRDAIGGDTIDSVTGTISTAIDKVQTFKDGLHALHSGDVTEGLNALSKSLHGILPDSFMDNADNIVKTFSDAHDAIRSTLTDTLDTGKELREALQFGEGGALAGLLAGAGEVVSPLAILLAGGFAAGSATLGPLMQHDFNSWAYGDQGIPVPEHALGGLPESPVLPRSLGASVIPRPRYPMTPSSELPSFAPLDMPDDPRNPSNSPRSAPTPVIESGGTSTGSARVDAQQAVVDASVATISAGSLSLGGISLAGLMPQGVGAATHSPSGWGSGSAAAPSFASGFPTLPSAGLGHGVGRASGGMIPGDSPGYDNMFGILPGGRPIGLEGGEGILNPNAMQLPGVADLVSGLQGFDGGSSGSGVLNDILGGGQKTAGPNVKGQSPGGIKGQSPGGVQASQPTGADLHASQPGQAPDQPSPPQTIIPQGKGEGFGISGGILGAAEGAASTGANLFAPGSGAAVQIGMEEANKAIETGVKAGITLGVEAPLDTFWLSDSGLSDPSHSWFGKLGLNMIGQTAKSLNMQNLAGQTQAPLTGQQGQSPLGGKPQQQGGPAIHIENQYNNSDVDHEANNRSLVNQMNAYSPTY